MENRAKSIKERCLKIINRMFEEQGAIIVEASIVFPVMFFVLLFIIFIGNVYYEQAKIDEIVQKYAVKGAECVADPFLYDYETTKKVPTNTEDIDVEPYRYIFGSLTDGSITNVENKISQAVKAEINDTGLVFFSNSKATVVGSDNDKIATFKNYVVYSTFVVQVNYKVKLPIAFLGEDSPVILSMSSRSEVPVSDAPEFIRNVDMAVDLLDGTTVGNTIQSMFDKINSFINQFSEK